MYNKAKKLINNIFFQGTVILTITGFVGGFMNYFFNSLTSRALGPARYSEITTTISYLVVLSIPVQVVSVEIIRKLGAIGSKRIEKIAFWEDWFWTKIKKHWWLIIPYFSSLFFLPKLTNLSFSFSFVLLLIIICSIIGIFYGPALQGLRFFTAWSLFTLLGIFIKLLGAILVFFKIDGLQTIGLFLSLAAILPLVTIIVYFRKKFPRKNNQVINRDIKGVLINRSILIVTLSLISVNLLNNLDIFYVKKFISAEQAGLYGAWNLMAKIIYYILGSLTSIAFIFFTSKENEKNHKKALGLISLIYILGGVVLTFVYYFFGRHLILLIFGSKYLGIQSELLIASIVGIFNSLIIVLNSFMLAKKSLLSLTPLVGVFVFLLSLVLFGKTIQQVIYLNLITVTSCYLIYLLLWLKEKIVI